MDFQLILYIIIVIVWLVLDNYRRIKKKQEQGGQKYTTSTPKQTEKPYTTLEDILREFGMEEEPEIIVEKKPKPQTERRTKTPPKQKAFSTGHETYEGAANYESSINKDYKFSSETFNKVYRTSTIEAGDIKRSEIKDMSVTGKKSGVDFDLRKAVIWSEILKRPYA